MTNSSAKSDAELIKNARRKLGVSQSKMADMLGLSDSRIIRRYESGSCAVGQPVKLLLAYVLRDHGLSL